MWENLPTDERQIKVGDHEIHYGGAPDGFCYTHNSFDCVLTPEEQQAVNEV